MLSAFACLVYATVAPTPAPKCCGVSGDPTMCSFTGNVGPANTGTCPGPHGALWLCAATTCSHVVLLDHILTSLPTRPRSLLSPQQVTQARHATARHARTPSSAPASPRRRHPKCVRDHLPPPFFARHCPPALHQRAAPLRANDVAPV